MKHTLKNWTFHGGIETTKLLAKTFPRSGRHFLVGEYEAVNGAVIADLATALASDVTTCGLGPVGENGVRASRSPYHGFCLVRAPGQGNNRVEKSERTLRSPPS